MESREMLTKFELGNPNGKAYLGEAGTNKMGILTTVN
jgi:hypothetical protein